MNLNDSDNPDAPNPSPEFKEISPERQKQLMKQLEYLKTIELPEQRSPEWYEMRNNMITASDFGVVMEGKTAFGTVEEVAYTKCGAMKREFNQASLDIMEHGVKHEENATRFYELLRGVTVTEFGCLPHPKYSFIGASPDGISSDAIMLEIKCPPKRKITGTPRKYYWHQMQGQLEVCDLDRCDFLECKIVEYETVDRKPDRKGYYEDTADETEEGVDYRLTAPKGSVICYKKPKSDNPNKLHYLYSEFNIKEPEHRAWELEQIEWISENWFQYVKTTYWEMLHYSNVPVYRDPEWFPVALKKLGDVWKKVEYFREHPDKLKADYAEYKRLKRLKSRRRGAEDWNIAKKVNYRDTTILPLLDMNIEGMSSEEFKLVCQFYYGRVKFGADVFTDKGEDILAIDCQYDYDNDVEFQKLVKKKKMEAYAAQEAMDELEAEFYPHLRRDFRGGSRTASLFSDGGGESPSKPKSKTFSLFSDGGGGKSSNKTKSKTFSLFSDGGGESSSKSKGKTGKTGKIKKIGKKKGKTGKNGKGRVVSSTFGLFSS